MGCYIWYSEEGTPGPPSPIAVPNVTCSLGERLGSQVWPVSGQCMGLSSSPTSPKTSRRRPRHSSNNGTSATIFMKLKMNPSHRVMPAEYSTSIENWKLNMGRLWMLRTDRLQGRRKRHRRSCQQLQINGIVMIVYLYYTAELNSA